MTTLLVAVLIVLVGSALCSGSEAVLFSVSSSRIRRLVDEGSRLGPPLAWIKENMGQPIATIVVLNNIFNIVGSLVVGSIAIVQFGDAAFGVFSASLTFMVIVFSEIVPKTLGERHADAIAPIIALPILGLTKAFRPITWLLEKMVVPLTRGERRNEIDEAEITLLARLGTTEGQILRSESEMIANVFRLDDVTAEQILTPRVSLTYVKAAAGLEEVREEILKSRHSRILAVGEDVDDVLGYVLKDEILAGLVEGKAERKVGAFVRQLEMVPGNLKANELLGRFRARREHIALVLDEYGGVEGVVTMEDVLEVLTGPIVDETDLVENLQDLSRRLARIRARRYGRN
jgi:CBS domain containing-hemolysin-like protein